MKKPKTLVLTLTLVLVLVLLLAAVTATACAPGPTPSPTPSPTPGGGTPQEIARDDGAMDSWLSLGGLEEYGFMVRLDAGQPFVVTTIRVYSRTVETPVGDMRMTARLTDASLAVLWEGFVPMADIPKEPAWVEIPVPDIATDGEFCVLVFAPTLGKDKGPYIGLDQSGPNLGSEQLSHWQPVDWNAGVGRETVNFMIRAEGYAG